MGVIGGRRLDATELNQGFRIGPWQVLPAEGQFRGPDGVVNVEPKVMRLLVCLASNVGQAVNHDALIADVWNDRVVSDGAVFRCIAELRKKLGDSGTKPRYVQTVHKIGYRLIEPVRALEHGSYPKLASDFVPQEGRSVEAWEHPLQHDGLEIIRLLGKGSMAQVHLAREASLERLVAVKTLKSELTSDVNACQRFEREAQAAARLLHPNVTTVYRVGTLPDGAPYIVQQFVEGRTLAQMLEVEGELSVERAVDMFSELASALAAAHNKRIIHRDVKPGNILVEQESGRVLLTDFGIAGIQETGSTQMARLTRVGEILGDPRYISPEQARGDPLTAQCDIYSLGIVAFMLFGRRYPYEEDLAVDPATVHIKNTPQSLADIRQDLPAPITRIVQQCLQKNPSTRPTAEQVVRHLAGEDATDEKPGQMRKRSRKLAMFSVGIAATIVILIVAWKLIA